MSEFFKYRKKEIILAFFMLFVGHVFAQHRAMQDKQSKKWGFLNANGGWVVKPTFEDYDKFNSFSGVRQYAVVKHNGYWGCIGENGTFVCRAVFSNNKDAALAGQEWQKKKKAGAVLFNGFDAPSHKWGFCDYNGLWVIKPIFDEIDVEADFKNDSKYAVVKHNGCWGCVSRDGKFAVKPVIIKKDDARRAGTEWLAFTPVGNSIFCAYDADLRKFGFANSHGKWTVKPIFDALDPNYDFDNGRPFAVVKYKGRWGCINRLGAFIVKPTYTESAKARQAGFAWQNVAKNKSLPEASKVANFDDGKFLDSYLANGLTASNERPDYSNLHYTTGGGKQTSVAKTSGSAPTINILTPKNGEAYTSSNVTFTYEAKTADGQPAEIVAYINGELQPKTKGVKRVGNQLQLVLPRNAEDCRVQLIAKDKSGRNSDPAVVLLHYRGDRPKPNLHVLAVGVSDYDQPDLKLQHAAKDASDFVSAISSCNLSHYQQLKTPALITNKLATDKNIKRGLSKIVNEVEQGDVVMLFFSGHGSKEGGETYFLSVNAESNDLFSSAVNFDEIRTATKRLKDKKCKVLLFMDACHSGALYGQKSTQESFAFSEPGVIGFYSSTESQKSNESEQWSNGIFTKALIEGLKGKAMDAEGNITLDDLERYIRETVRKATKGKQMPIFENKQGNFVLFGK